MNQEILINVSQTETRAALVENGLLQEIYLERTRNKGLVGNIYKGKVVRVLPGMQAAFVDIGLERAGFIHVRDFACPVDASLSEADGKEKGLNGGRGAREEKDNNDRDIRELVREGQTIVVQVTKDPISSKGARLTTQLSVSARNLVYMPDTPQIGISARIEDEEERERLRTLVEKARLQTPGRVNDGFIVRTVAEGTGEEELASDIPFLYKLWSSIEETMKKTKAPAPVYEDMPLFMRTLRDLVRPEIEKVRIDNIPAYERMSRFVNKYGPEMFPILELYDGERPLFDLYGVEDELEKALVNQIPLKSGGYLIIEQTEAMITVDVNTGGFVGHRNLEETIFKTNLEAANTVARQLRLRNLGGIIIIDFIDMMDEEHQRQVLRVLEKAMEGDRARTTITGVSDLGLVEMTRKRTRESLGQILCEPCPICKGRGVLKSAQTVCYEIFREILRESRVYDSQKFIVLASQVVIDCLLDEESTSVADLETVIKRTIEFRVEAIYNQEQYDIVLV